LKFVRNFFTLFKTSELKLSNWHNSYATKKTCSNGLLNFALLANNESQLKTLFSNKNTSKKTPKWYVCTYLVSLSIIFQILMLVLSGIQINNPIHDDEDRYLKQRGLVLINNIVHVLSWVITALNIIINVFIQIDLN